MRYIFFHNVLSDYECELNDYFKIYRIASLSTNVKSAYKRILNNMHHKINNECDSKRFFYINYNSLEDLEKRKIVGSLTDVCFGKRNGKYFCKKVVEAIATNIKLNDVLTRKVNKIIKNVISENLEIVYDKVKCNIIDYNDGTFVKDFYEKICLDISKNLYISKRMHKLFDKVNKVCNKSNFFMESDYDKEHFDNKNITFCKEYTNDFVVIVTDVISMVLKRYVYSIITVKINDILVKNKKFKYIGNDFNISFLRFANIVYDDITEFESKNKELKMKKSYKSIYYLFRETMYFIIKYVKLNKLNPIECFDEKGKHYPIILKYISSQFDLMFLDLNNLINETNTYDENYLNYRDNCLIDREAFDKNKIMFTKTLLENMIQIFKNVANLTINEPDSYQYYIKAVAKMMNGNGLEKTDEALIISDNGFDKKIFKEGLIHDARISKPFTRFLKREKLGKDQNVMNSLVDCVSGPIEKIINIKDKNSSIFYLDCILTHIRYVKGALKILYRSLIKTNIYSVLGNYENINIHRIDIYPKIKDNVAHFSKNIMF